MGQTSGSPGAGFHLGQKWGSAGKDLAPVCDMLHRSCFSLSVVVSSSLGSDERCLVDGLAVTDEEDVGSIYRW